MNKYKWLITFLIVIVLVGALWMLQAKKEVEAAYANSEIALGVATEKIMNSNMPESVRTKILTDIFSELPRRSSKATISLSQSEAASEKASKSKGMGQDPNKLRGKSAEARKNVCKGAFQAYDSVAIACTRAQTRTSTTDAGGPCDALTNIKAHLEARSCTR